MGWGSMTSEGEATMENISRRSLLKSGAAAAAAATVAAAVPSAAHADEAAANTAKSEDWLGEAPALTVDDCAETVECEVLVVGSALAGSMAAYGAVKNGAQVTIIERNAAPHIGGMTISFLNSKTQLDAGLPEYDKVNVANQMFNLTQYRSDMKLNALWCNRSGEILDNMVEDFLKPYNQYYQPLSLEGIFPDPTQEINSYISTGVAFSEDTDILTDFTHNIQKFLTDQGVRYDFEVKGELLYRPRDPDCDRRPLQRAVRGRQGYRLHLRGGPVGGRRRLCHSGRSCGAFHSYARH